MSRKGLKRATDKQKFLFVRWLGAFGHARSLTEALNFEAGYTLASTNRLELACEPIRLWDGGDYSISGIDHAKVGLVVKRNKIRKIFTGDVWSVTTPDGTLKPTRKAVGDHWEAFCDATDYIKAVVIKDDCPEDKAQEAKEWADRNGFNVVSFDSFTAKLSRKACSYDRYTSDSVSDNGEVF